MAAGEAAESIAVAAAVVVAEELAGAPVVANAQILTLETQVEEQYTICLPPERAQALWV